MTLKARVSKRTSVRLSEEWQVYFFAPSRYHQQFRAVLYHNAKEIARGDVGLPGRNGEFSSDRVLEWLYKSPVPAAVVGGKHTQIREACSDLYLLTL